MTLPFAVEQLSLKMKLAFVCRDFSQSSSTMMIGGSRNSWHKKRRSSSFVVVPAHFLCSSSIASSSSKGSFDDGLFLLATSAFAPSSDDLVLNILINIIISLPRITNNPIVRVECFFCWCLVQQLGRRSERKCYFPSFLFWNVRPTKIVLADFSLNNINERHHEMLCYCK